MNTIEKRAGTQNRGSPRQRGFTLLEIVVVLGVIAILVAILVPTVLKYLSDSQRSRAEADVRTINAAINSLIKDTGRFPGDKLGKGKKFLVGPGNLAGGATWAVAADSEELRLHLLENNPGGTPYPSSGRFQWRGAYIQADGLVEDPWGNAYEINADSLVGGNTNPTWVISAGPDGLFQTAPTDTALSGDDIGVRIK